MSENLEPNVVLPTEGEIIHSLINKYRDELAAATTSTDEAIKKLKQQMQLVERNQIMITAQARLLDTIEKDLNTTLTTLNTPIIEGKNDSKQ